MGVNQASIHNHLLKMATLPNLINADLAHGFTVAQVAQKYGWTDPMAGGGVTPDTCLAMGRRSWAFDMMDRPDTRALRSNPLHGVFHLIKGFYGLSAQRKNPT